MWGVKKKQKEEDLEDKLNDVLLKAEKRKSKTGGTASKNEQPPPKVERKPLARQRGSSNSNDLFGSANPAEILGFYKLAIQKFKEIIDTDQFDEYFNKETFEQVLKVVSEQNLNPEITENLLKLNFDDLSEVKKVMKQGVEIAEGYLEQVAEVINDPTKFAELLDQVPAEFKGVLQALLSGDVSTIKQLLLTLPGKPISPYSQLIHLISIFHLSSSRCVVLCT